MSDDPGNWVYVTVVADDPQCSYPAGINRNDLEAHATFNQPLAQPIRFPYGTKVQVALYKMTYKLAPVTVTGTAQNPSQPPCNSFYVSSDVVASNQLVGSQLTTTLRKITLNNSVPVLYGVQTVTATGDNAYQHYDLPQGNPWSNGANVYNFDTADLGPVATYRRFDTNGVTPVIKWYEAIKGSTTHFHGYHNKPIEGTAPDFVHKINPSTGNIENVNGAVQQVPTTLPSLKDGEETREVYAFPGDQAYIPQELRWVECSGSELTNIATVITNDADDETDGQITKRFSAPISLTYVFRLLPLDPTSVQATI